MSTDETSPIEAAQQELRRQFAPTSVGTLPKPHYKDSKKERCNECGRYHGLPADHLPYVGHAAVTDRLLAVDPHWGWEPMATDERGLPLLDRAGNLWIRLTVCGVTRIGVGDGRNAKELIGDALRNAAMRFGVALDLWSKEELESSLPPVPEPQPTDLEVARDRAWRCTAARGDDEVRKTLLVDFLASIDTTPETATAEQWTAAYEELKPRDNPS